MSLLNQKVNQELPVNIKVCKRGGVDEYQNGKISVVTEKAILVQWDEKLEAWLPLKSLYNNEDHYGGTFKMWNKWQRISIKPINS